MVRRRYLVLSFRLFAELILEARRDQSSGFLFSPTFQALLYHFKLFKKNSSPAMDLYLPLIVRTRFKLSSNQNAEWQRGELCEQKRGNLNER